MEDCCLVHKIEKEDYKKLLSVLSTSKTPDSLDTFIAWCENLKCSPCVEHNEFTIKSLDRLIENAEVKKLNTDIKPLDETDLFYDH